MRLRVSAIDPRITRVSVLDDTGCEVAHMILSHRGDGKTIVEEVFTQPEYRRQGLASRMMQEWMKLHPDARIYHRHLSDAGRQFRNTYRASRGFRPWDERTA